MNRFFSLSLLTLTLLCASLNVSAKETAIYAFGFGTCLGDSIVYVSQLQVLPQAQINKKTGFLEDRDQYSAQMEQALQQRYGRAFTCTIFFATKKNKAEKQFLNLKKQLGKDKSVRAEYLPPTDFQFAAVIPSTESDDSYFNEAPAEGQGFPEGDAPEFGNPPQGMPPGAPRLY